LSSIHSIIHLKLKKYANAFKVKIRKIKPKKNENVIKMRTDASVIIIHENLSKCHKYNTNIQMS